MSTKTRIDELETHLKKCLSAMEAMTKQTSRMYSMLSYTTKKMEMLYAISSVKQLFGEQDMEEAHKTVMQFWAVMYGCSNRRRPLKDRIRELVEWNDKYGIFLYISPVDTEISKALDDYEGPDKEDLKTSLSKYIQQEDKVPEEVVEKVNENENTAQDSGTEAEGKVS